MRRFGLALTIAFAGVTGCGAHHGVHYALKFSYTGSCDGLAQANAAAAEWRDVCGSDISVDRGGDDIPLEEISGTDLGGGDEGFVVIGQTIFPGGGGAVSRIRFLRAPDGKATLVHEFGHALGIWGHLDHGIMSSNDNAYSRVTLLECNHIM